jgi:hypothetical protein
MSSFLKHDISGTGFCLRFQKEPTQMGPIDRAVLTGPETETSYTRHVHKVRFPLVPQLANLILREAAAHT